MILTGFDHKLVITQTTKNRFRQFQLLTFRERFSVTSSGGMLVSLWPSSWTLVLFVFNRLACSILSFSKWRRSSSFCFRQSLTCTFDEVSRQDADFVTKIFSILHAQTDWEYEQRTWFSHCIVTDIASWYEVDKTEFSSNRFSISNDWESICWTHKEISHRLGNLLYHK